jgi:hypothetical protein
MKDAVRPKRKRYAKREIINEAARLQSAVLEEQVRQRLANEQQQEEIALAEETALDERREKRQLEKIDRKSARLLAKKRRAIVLRKRGIRVLVCIVSAIALFLIYKLIRRMMRNREMQQNVIDANTPVEINMDGGYESVNFSAPPPLPASVPDSPETTADVDNKTTDEAREEARDEAREEAREEKVSKKCEPVKARNKTTLKGMPARDARGRFLKKK